MVWTFFVLDYDGTYDNEDDDSYGVVPSVYLIPLEKQKEVEQCAREAHNDFHKRYNEDYMCIGDCFENRLAKNNIDFKEIGSIDLKFKERQVDYLADYIPREIV